MQLAEIIGYIASVFSTVSALPQLIKIIKSKSAEDVSISMFLILAIGCILWFSYGLLLGALPIIIANFILFSISMTIIYFARKYSKTKEKVSVK